MRVRKASPMSVVRLVWSVGSIPCAGWAERWRGGRSAARSLLWAGSLSTTTQKRSSARARPETNPTNHTGVPVSLALRALAGPRWLLGCGGRRGGGSRCDGLYSARCAIMPGLATAARDSASSPRCAVAAARAARRPFMPERYDCGGETPKWLGRQWRCMYITSGDLSLQKKCSVSQPCGAGC